MCQLSNSAQKTILLKVSGPTPIPLGRSREHIWGSLIPVYIHRRPQTCTQPTGLLIWSTWRSISSILPTLPMAVAILPQSLSRRKNLHNGDSTRCGDLTTRQSRPGHTCHQLGHGAAAPCPRPIRHIAIAPSVLTSADITRPISRMNLNGRDPLLHLTRCPYHSVSTATNLKVLSTDGR